MRDFDDGSACVVEGIEGLLNLLGFAGPPGKARRSSGFPYWVPYGAARRTSPARAPASDLGRASLVYWLRAFLYYAAVEQMDGTVGVSGVAGVVGDDTNSGASAVQLAEQIHYYFAVGGVQVPGGFIR